MKRLLAVQLWVCALVAAPTITKVEPPNWWVGHSINPVRVLIRGTGFAGARAVAADAGIQVSNVSVNQAGTYIFADVRVLKTGQHPIKVITADGSALAHFEITKPLPRQGRFQGFSPDDLIYLIMPDRFANGDPSNDDPAVSKGMHDRGKSRYYHGGDFQGIQDHLPYLKDLGVTTLWINPVYDNVNHLNRKETYGNEAITDYHGYGAVDFYGVEEHFGDLASFRKLVDAAHAQGLKVMLDMVANHSGPYHPWVTDPPLPDWFHGTAEQHINETWQLWTLIDPHARVELRKPVLDGWFIDILPDLNQESPEVARYLIQNTLWWVGVAGLDGIRQDTWPYVPRTFWSQWMGAIKREYPELRVVGETFDGDPALVSYFQGGRKQDGVDTGVDSLFDFPLYFKIRQAFANGGPIRELASMLSHDYLYPDPKRLVTFLGLHDVERFMHEKGASVDGLKTAFTFLLTARGIPMIYYGDEIGMPGGGDPDNRRDFPGGWAEDTHNAFRDRSPEEAAVFEHVRKLAHLRATIPALRRGEMTDLQVTDHSYAYRRGEAVVLLNNGMNPETIRCGVAAGVWRDVLGSLGEVTAKDGQVLVSLPPRSSAILQRK